MSAAFSVVIGTSRPSTVIGPVNVRRACSANGSTRITPSTGWPPLWGKSPSITWATDDARAAGVAAGHRLETVDGLPYLRWGREGHWRALSPDRASRYGFLDLMYEGRWGGLISGDKVQVDYSTHCPCGRRGPTILDTIVRYSQVTGGDDHIGCAGTIDAYVRGAMS